MLVTKVAVYVLPASRQLGGAPLNDVIRGDDPSTFGHVVATVSLPPGTGAATGGVPVAAVVAEPAVVVAEPAVVVDDPTFVVEVPVDVDTLLELPRVPV
jgi:hypothetical protein